MRQPRLYELHPVRGAGRVQVDATCERLGAWNEPSRLFRVWLEGIDTSEAGSATVRWSADRLDPLETLAGQPIRRVRVLERVPADDHAVPLLPEGTVAEDLVVEVELSTSLPPAFTPYARHPKRDGELSFDTILEKLASLGPVRVSGVHEAEHYWAFARWQIGSCGCAVERGDGHIADFGSAFPWDDWLWCYERGLVRDVAGALVVENVRDVERAVALLDTLGIGFRTENRGQLAAPPVVFPSAVNWLAIPTLRRDADAAFSWHVEDDGGGAVALGRAKSIDRPDRPR